MATNDGGPAFPRPASIDTSSGTLPDGDRVAAEQDGMTLRDWFAGQALAGLLAWSPAGTAIVKGDDALGNMPFGEAAAMAYEYADAMLAARH